MEMTEAHARRVLGEQAEIERMTDHGRTLCIWFRFIEDPVLATQKIARLQSDLAAMGADRRVESYLRLL